MDIINKCFDTIVLLRVENKEGFWIYAAALVSSFGDGKKYYLLAFVPDHLAFLEKANLKDLQWENVQTRSLPNGYTLPNKQPMPQQRWHVPHDLPNFMFIIQSRDEYKSKYIADSHPLELVLIHDPKKKSSYQHHNKINLVAALSTFKCVISNTNKYTGASVSALSKMQTRATTSINHTPIVPERGYIAATTDTHFSPLGAPSPPALGQPRQTGIPRTNLLEQARQNYRALNTGTVRKTNPVSLDRGGGNRDNQPDDNQSELNDSYELIG